MFPIFYKGAGPGTHWHVTNAMQAGFSCANGTVPPGPNMVTSHIAFFSHPSSYISLTTSYAVARQYGLQGPAGVASQAAPGYVYQIDLNQAPGDPVSFALVNPLDELRKLDPVLVHEHSGDQDLILGLAAARLNAILNTGVPHPGGQLYMPTLSNPLRALVFAIRDAEMLVHGVIPRACVVHRHSVY
jgi:hypothetical protein